MKISKLNDKKIAILGFGVTGQEVYKALQKNYSITIVNDSVVDGFETISATEVINQGIDFDIIIKSPGVPYSNPLLKYTQAEVTNDIELTYEVIREYKLNTKIVAVTGTNGKTTTTQFICDVLNASGAKAVACGNIGQSPLLVVEEHLTIDYLVMELSSYQLKQVDSFKPDFGLFLNVSPDHIDYHGDFADYLNSKCNLFKNMNSNDKLVLDAEMVVDHPQVNWPSYATFGVSDERLASVMTIAMPKQNYCLIFDLLASIGFEDEFIVSQLNQFKGLEHRLELVDSEYSFRAINDSKATNVNATNVAIKGLNAPTVLIVGGSEKVEDYSLLDYKNPNIKQVIAYGATKSKFDFIPGVVKFDLFADAVNHAIDITKENEILLLSPACASFDQHRNYGERGNQFKAILKGMNE